MRPKLFISSSSEGLRLAYAAQHHLKKVAESTVWDQGAIKPSATVLESLGDYLNSSDFALFAFTPDDTTKIRGQEMASARDNVILELGLFTGQLGKDRCFILVPAKTDLRIPTDLLGLTLLEYEAERSDDNLIAASGSACFQIQEAMRRLGSRFQFPSPPTEETETQEDRISPEKSQPEVSAETTAAASSEETQKYRWLYAYIEQDYSRAIELIQERLTEEQDEAERINLQSWLGHSLYEQRPQEGERHLKKLIEEHPTSSDPYIHLARAYHSRHRYTEALSTLEQGLSSAQERPILLTIKAEILFEIEHTEEALTSLRQGVAENPEEDDFYNELADRLIELGRYEEARDVLEEGLRNVAGYETLLAKLAELLHDHFEPESALFRYTQLIDLRPKNTTYLTLRANILLDLDLYDLALRDYKQANELAEEKLAWILGNIGNIYKNRGFFREAIPYFNQALTLNPGNEYAHKRLAQALEMRDEEEKKLSDICQQAARKIAKRQSALSRPELGPNPLAPSVPDADA